MGVFLGHFPTVSPSRDKGFIFLTVYRPLFVVVSHQIEELYHVAGARVAFSPL